MAPKTDLIIVESPTKARTIQKYAGPDFRIMASVGHIKDLPKSKMGVNTSDRFQPEYKIIRGKHKVVSELKKAAEKSRFVYLAPDPDREGEAIAWHIAEELKLPPEKAKRVLFNEITNRGIRQGLSSPVALNRNKFESQQARRILDRLVGYEVSPLLWRKIQRGLSAGRVQSVALRLIVEREREIRKFKPQEYWNLFCELSGSSPPPFRAKLFSVDGRKKKITDGESAEAIRSELETGHFVISDVEKKRKRRAAPPPFITSKLQQEAARRYRFSAKRTMRVAQQLYEGVEIGNEGAAGLITYMRTDSTRLADDAVKAAREYILQKFSKTHLPDKANVFTSKKKTVQDAHEAIRPTSTEYPPEKINKYLKPDQRKIYRLIWERFIACQMKAAQYDHTTFKIKAGENERLELRAQGRILAFSGWLAATGEDDTRNNGEEAGSTVLPPLEKGEKPALSGKGAQTEQKFTQPPPRFTEGTLIKELEDKGIGRPSTYASIVTTIQDRRYMEKTEGKLVPTELGILVSDRLVSFFPDLFDVTFTAQMESSLDRVEEGSEDWVALLSRFYSPFHKQVESAMVNMEEIKPSEPVEGEFCEKCKAPMVIRWGRHGKFLSCSNYPKCRHTRPMESDKKLSAEASEAIAGIKCEKCGRSMVLKHGRFGEFLACTGYPECKNTRPVPTGIKCPRPECNGELIERRTKKGRTFYGCSNYSETGCDFALWNKPVKEPCPDCRAEFLVRTGRAGKTKLSCANEDCKYSRDE